MGQTKKSKLYDVKMFLNKRHVSTVRYQLPYALAKFVKRMAELDVKNPKGTYFTITPNKK